MPSAPPACDEPNAHPAARAVSRYVALQTARLLPRRARNDVSQLSGEGVQGQARPVLLSTWATGGPGGVAVAILLLGPLQDDCAPFPGPVPCARKPRVKGMAYQTGPTPSVPRGEKRKAKPDDRASPPDDQPCSLPRLRRARAEGRTRMGDRGCLLIGVPLNGCWDRASDSVGGAIGAVLRGMPG